MVEARDKSKHTAARAPVDIEVFELALQLKIPPDEVRGYPRDVLELAVIMDRKPEEVKRWRGRDRRWLLTVYGVQQRALPELARRAK
jgi:hypothetical protein